MEPTLPEDIILIIISKLPLKYIFRCKFLSKSFYAQITALSFITAVHNSNPYLSETKYTGLLFHYFRFKEQGSEPSLFHINSENPSPIPLDYPLFTQPDKQLQNVLVGSCKGILCFLTFPSSDQIKPELRQPVFHSEAPVYLYNPLTTEQIYLPSFSSLSLFDTDIQPDFVFGFGFDNLKKVFKVVVILLHDQWSISVRFTVLIHTLGTNTWRRRDYEEITDERYYVGWMCSRALINGSLHWLKVGDWQQGIRSIIVSFNLGTEEFGQIELPESSRSSFDNKGYDPLGEIDGFLALIGMTYSSDIEVWVMKKYNVGASWTKHYHISSTCLEKLGYGLWCIVPLCTPLNSVMFLHCHDIYATSGRTKDGCVVAYDIESNQFVSTLELFGEGLKLPHHIAAAVPFEGSLISPKQLRKSASG